ncbi:MAG: aminotransferase class I/II-fold pyridoxal phosphate-dependent enzyme, partial [Candidatus Omnitrophica bacterium]|nr:aminotransferase class I/II-fold pyridoxal phosphate-dependent enzyme [Candidatus Omnitrophota bacterium]
MVKIDFSNRLKKLPPYLFAEIDRMKGELKRKGVEFIDLSIGDPDILAPRKVIDILYSSAKEKENQKYSLDQGKLTFRLAVKEWFKRRFKVNLDEDKEILPLIGSKEGLVHLPLSLVNRGDYIIVPSPGYPGYRGGAILSEANIYELPLLEENSFLPDLGKIPKFIRKKAKLIYLNYPNNPTTALANKDFLEKIVKFCSHYGIILAYDNAYSEIYFEEKPLSVLEIEEAKDIAIEFHSLSKTFCMTGFRIGWACGNSNLITALLKVKTNIDSGIFCAIQDCAAYALEKEKDYIDNLRKIIKERRDIFVDGLKKGGIENIYAQSTFYVWVKIP